MFKIIRKRGRRGNYFILTYFITPKNPIMLGRYRTLIAAKKAIRRFEKRF